MWKLTGKVEDRTEPIDEGFFNIFKNDKRSSSYESVKVMLVDLPDDERSLIYKDIKSIAAKHINKSKYKKYYKVIELNDDGIVIEFDHLKHREDEAKKHNIPEEELGEYYNYDYKLPPEVIKVLEKQLISAGFITFFSSGYWEKATITIDAIQTKVYNSKYRKSVD